MSAICPTCENHQSTSGKCTLCGQFNFIACRVCEFPIDPKESHLTTYEYRVHLACNHCRTCKGPINEQVRNNAEKNGWPYGEHVHCNQKRLAEEFAKQPVTITQGMLNDLNRMRLIFEPSLDLSVETNQKTAESEYNKTFGPAQFIHEQNLEYLYKFLARVEMVAALTRLAISKDKAKVKAMITEREIEKFNKAKEDREKVHVTPIERKRLSNEDKAIRALMTATGMNEETARAQVEKQKTKIN